MYKGWIKPGQPLIACVQNRKGRFKGTMLAEKLDKIEGILAAVQATNGTATSTSKDALADVAHEVIEESEPISPRSDSSGSKPKRKSFVLRSKSTFELSRHTQGHPSDIYEISQHLGDGDTSSCWFGFHKTSKVPCAIKAEQKSDEIWLWEEINIMRKINHPHVVKLFETFENEAQVFMVLELCDGGRLFDRIVGRPDACARKGLTCSIAVRLMRQLATCIEYLHTLQVCHRDIQLDNFLLKDDQPLHEGMVKLIDFTTAKEWGPGLPPLTTKICTPGYVAREILSRTENVYTEKVDIWSLGVVFFIILCGSPPFHGDTDYEVLKKVKRGHLRFEPAEAWVPVPEEAKDLIKGMICAQVEDRLSASATLGHPWLVEQR